MSTYKGKPVRVDAPAADIAEKFADLTHLQASVDALPEAERQRIGQTRFEKDAIIIVNPQIGEMRFNVTERNDRQVKMQAQGMLPMAMLIDLPPVDDGAATEVVTAIDINLPAMLKPFVGPQLQKAADQFGVMMGRIATGRGV